MNTIIKVDKEYRDKVVNKVKKYNEVHKDNKDSYIELDSEVDKDSLLDGIEYTVIKKTELIDIMESSNESYNSSDKRLLDLEKVVSDIKGGNENNEDYTLRVIGRAIKSKVKYDNIKVDDILNLYYKLTDNEKNQLRVKINTYK
jgi:hypothetical protein